MPLAFLDGIRSLSILTKIASGVLNARRHIYRHGDPGWNTIYQAEAGFLCVGCRERL
jgi:hypothetical protein